MNETDTRILVSRARSGDRSAFDELVTRHRSHLKSLVERRLGPRIRRYVTVDDVLQETMVRAFASLDRFEWRDDRSGTTSPVFRWLSGIAIRVILEQAKRHRRAPPIALDFDFASPDEVSPSRGLARKERMARFEAALQRLSPDQGIVLRMVRLEGRPIHEVAGLTGRSPNAVSQLVLRALRKLRRELAPLEGTESLHLTDQAGEPGGQSRE